MELFSVEAHATQTLAEQSQHLGSCTACKPAAYIVWSWNWQGVSQDFCHACELLHGESAGILDVIEAPADPKGAFAYSGVFKASTKLPTHKAADPAMQTLWTEPVGLCCRARGRSWGQIETGWVKCPQAGALADQQLCMGTQLSHSSTTGSKEPKSMLTKRGLSRVIDNSCGALDTCKVELCNLKGQHCRW